VAAQCRPRQLGHLKDIVHHYEQAFGFVFTANEEAHLVAFLEAL